MLDVLWFALLLVLTLLAVTGLRVWFDWVWWVVWEAHRGWRYRRGKKLAQRLKASE